MDKNFITRRVEIKRHLLQAAVLCIAAVSGWGAQPVGFLQLKAFDGDGAINDVLHHIGHAITVEARDENNQLLRGVEITFTAPAEGASGLFANGTRTDVATTDSMGRARSSELKPNTIEGRFLIVISGRLQNRQATISASQSNTSAAILQKK